MAAHVVTLYDEIHRTFYQNDNLNNDPHYKEVRISQDFSGSYLLLVSSAGVKTTIRLKGIKIPPSTGEEFDTFYKALADKFATEIKSL